MSRGRKQVGEGRPSFRSCAVRPSFGAERATPGTCGARRVGQGSALRQEVSLSLAPAVMLQPGRVFTDARGTAIRLKKPTGHLLAWGLNSQPRLTYRLKNRCPCM